MTISKPPRGFKKDDIILRATKVLKVEDGSVLLIKQGSTLSKQIEFARLQSIFKDVLGEDARAIFIVVDTLDDLQILNENDMARLGWQRIPNWEPPQKSVEV